MIEQIAVAPEHKPGVPSPTGQSTNRLRRVGQVSTPTATAQIAARETAPRALLCVTNYVAFPVDRLKTDKTNESIHELKLELLGFRGGKLWFDLRYARKYVVYFDRGSRWAGEACAALAGLNLQNLAWEPLPLPAQETDAGSIFLMQPEYSEFVGDRLFVSGMDYLRSYDFKSKQWETFSVPWQVTPRLFAISGRLFAANEEAIYEILDGGRNMKILVSCRRRPAVSKLDLLSTLQQPCLFGSANYSVLVSIAAQGTNRVYGWDQTDWRELFSLNVAQPAEVFEDAVAFRAGFSAPGGQSGLWLWDKTSPAPTLWVVQTPKTQPFQQQFPGHPFFMPPRARESAPTQKPRWTLPMDVSLVHCALAFHKTDLYLFADHVILTNTAGLWNTLEKDGHHAELICLRPSLPEPLVVPVKFDVTRGEPPLMALGLKKITLTWKTRLPVLAFADKVLCIAHPAIPGVWLINLAELEKALEAQGQLAQPKSARPQVPRLYAKQPQWRTDVQPVSSPFLLPPRPMQEPQHQSQTQ